MDKERLEQLLSEISKLETLCETRCLEKMDATKTGFGKYNSVECISYNSEGVTLTVVDSGYDLRDTACISLGLNEICMNETEWKDYISELQQARIQEEYRKSLKKMQDEQERKKQQYLKLKQEFEN